ncbi:MAG: MotA/TolQ/ExbB proton channel family protein [Verrucomicrobiota bacterium]
MNCKAYLLTAIAAIGLLTTSSSQTLAQLQRQQETKLEDAIKRLSAQRQQIQSEQLPLARALRELEENAKTLRGELDEARKARDSRSVDLETLGKTVEAQRQEYAYITRSLLNEFNSSYESSLSVGELATFGSEIRELNLLLDNPAATKIEQLDSALALVGRSVDRLEGLLGGKRYSGQALDPEGQFIDGEFVQIGPLLYFSGNKTGVVEETKAMQARIHFIDAKSGEKIDSVLKTGSGLLPMDLSLGNAIAIQSTKDTPLEHIKKGGIWVYPIIGFAIVATIIAILKFLQIMTIRQPAPDTIYNISKLLREGKKAEAQQQAEAQPEPARDMLLRAVEHYGEPLTLVEEAMYESMLSTQPKLEKYLNVIAVTASVAPLLGLLGTVTGIIKTFNLMRVFGAGDPKPLISGISEALITTELGLVLAIPALVIHALLARKVAGAIAHIEKLSVALLNSLARDK